MTQDITAPADELNEILALARTIPNARIGIGMAGHSVDVPTPDGNGVEYLVDGYDTPLEAWRAAARTYLVWQGNREAQLALVRSCFGDAWGDLYVDEDHIAPLWDSAEPSVDTAYAGDVTLEYINLECARRVAAAIAVLAYGTAALEAKLGAMPASPVGA